MNLLSAEPPSAPHSSTPRFKHVAVVGKYQADGSREALDRVAQVLLRLGCDVSLEQDTGHNTGLSGYPWLSLEAIGQQCDLAVVIGGDGTLLGAGRILAPFGVPIIGINQGRLGFMTDVRYEDHEAMLTTLLNGHVEKDLRTLIHAQVWRDGEQVFESLALNDVVVNRASGGMIELKVEVNGQFVAQQRADGLIIATPTGSTAYALSAGGPLVHPSIEGWVMVPIAPHTLSNRPIVLPSDTEVCVEVTGGREVSANFDMQTLTSLLKGDRIVVRRAQHRLTLLHPVGWNHFSTLRNKLRWNDDVICPSSSA